MKLKTLKDLGCLNETHDHKTRGDFCIVRKDDLKAEAIKYVKDMQGFIDRNEGKISIRENDEDATLRGGIEWIKHFFNITSEDLT